MRYLNYKKCLVLTLVLFGIAGGVGRNPTMPLTCGRNTKRSSGNG